MRLQDVVGFTHLVLTSSNETGFKQAKVQKRFFIVLLLYLDNRVWLFYDAYGFWYV